MPLVNGILLVDKPEGMTSAGVVRVVKKKLNQGKVGHLGTLDPFASGLLPLCMGEGTKIAQFLTSERKAYTGTIRLGIETETFDSTGAITRTEPVPLIESATLRVLEQQFLGEYWQTPPMYSAIKRQGVPLYKFARRGMEVEREPRLSIIDHLALTDQGDGTLHFSLVCSKGTYVRSLAVDIGAVLGCGAHVATLRRTAFGPFVIAEAVDLSVATDGVRIEELPVLSMRQALQQYRSVPLSEREVALLRQGRQEPLQELPTTDRLDEVIQLVDAKDELVAMVQRCQRGWQLLRVFSTLH
ncbi:MAG: tRNA pseudouridine(55) synthase TruB [Candidatus Binatia bacterium]